MGLAAMWENMSGPSTRSITWAGRPSTSTTSSTLGVRTPPAGQVGHGAHSSRQSAWSMVSTAPVDIEDGAGHLVAP